jgi:hypothetical protein
MPRLLASRLARAHAAGHSMERWGAWALAFFALKGAAWLLLPVVGAAFFS